MPITTITSQEARRNQDDIKRMAAFIEREVTSTFAQKIFESVKSMAVPGGNIFLVCSFKVL